MNAIAAIVHRDYRQRITNVGFVFWDLCVPIAYLTLFGTGLDRTVGNSVLGDAPQVGYMAFLLPGVIAMTAFNIALNTSWGFFMDKDSGIFYELLAYPITRRQLLIGKSCFNVLLSVIGSFLAISVGVVVLNIEIHWGMLPLTTLAIFAGTAGWFFLMSIFAISLRRMDSFNTLTSVAYIVLMFVSTLFYPIAQMPGWFRWAAWCNPMTWQVDVLRFTLLDVGRPPVILAEALAFVVFTVICLGFAVRALNRAG